MFNLILTQVCNRRCQYCFAREMLTEGADAGKNHMEPSMFEAALALAERSRAPEIRFLGGEPTLHPEFVRFAQQVLGRGFKLLVFSNGLIPRGPLQFLKSCTQKQVGLLVNVNDEATYEPGEYDRLKDRLASLGQKVTCGYNISQPGFSLEPIIRLIPELNLARNIRLGMAQPVLSGKNQHLNWADVPAVANGIINAARLADPLDIILGLDCGFTQCMFREYYEDIISLRIHFKCCCQPVLDLTPDGKIWYCLALWGHPQFFKLGQFPDLQTFREEFEAKFAILRSAGLLDDCPDCKFRRTGQCSGGCFSRILQQWQ